jgi:hypothetical protein
VEEVRSLRRDIDLLKVGPAISMTMKKIAHEVSPAQEYTVTYTVYSESYAVLV